MKLLLMDIYWQKIEAKQKKKLKLIPFHDKYEITDLDDSDCGTDGCKLDENGIGIRWED